MADTAGLQPENLVMGPARLYICKLAFDPTLAYEPALADVNETPAPSAWYDTGITLGGADVTVSPTFSNLTGDQVPDKLGARLTDRDITCTLNFAEMTGQTLQYAWNLTPGPTGAGYQYYDLDASQGASRQPYRTLLIDGVGPDKTDGTGSLKRRAILRKSQPTSETKLQWEKATQQVLASTFQAFFVSEMKSPFRVIDEVEV